MKNTFPQGTITIKLETVGLFALLTITTLSSAQGADSVTQNRVSEATLSPMSTYCDRIADKISSAWIADPKITLPLHVAISISSTGQISNITGFATNDLQSFKIAEQQIQKLSRVNPPPPGTKQPLRIYLKFLDEGNAITASTFSEEDLAPYVQRMQKHIRKYFHAPNKGTFTRTIYQFKLQRNGRISDIKLIRSSNFEDVDLAAKKALENSSPQEPMADGSPKYIDTQFTFDYFPGKARNWN